MKHLFSFLLALCALTATAQLPSYLPTEGLVGWWPFNGNANDESGNGNHGVVNGATLTADRYGNANSSFSFSNSSISVPHNTALGIDQNAGLSISLWAFKTGNQNVQHLLGKRPNGAQQFNWQIAFNYPANVGLSFGGVVSGTFFGVVSQYQIPNNQWIHILCTYSANHYAIYIDGILLLDSSSTSFYTDVNTPLTFGNSGGFQAYSGLLDDIVIYNRALTQEEITALYTGIPTNNNGSGNTATTSVPAAISYQAVARTAQGQPLSDTDVQVRFTLLTDSLTGAAEYSESHSLTTNSLGLFTTAFGAGTPVSGTFSNINWASGSKYLKVELDAGTGFVDMGMQQLLSVPYSMRSNTSAKAGTIENTGLPVYANNAAALAGGLLAGQMYRTSTGDLKIVY
jgi:hypothetical protein